MIIPIRCMTCGNTIASKWKRYQELLATLGSDAEHNLITNSVKDLDKQTVECKAMNEIGLSRYCCRRHMLSHTDIIDLL